MILILICGVLGGACLGLAVGAEAIGERRLAIFFALVAAVDLCAVAHALRVLG